MSTYSFARLVFYTDQAFKVPIASALKNTASDRLSMGRTNFLNSELLRRGDVRTIHSGGRLIHALFHLDRPSVSLVVRTFNLDKGQPQYYYSRPYLALHDQNLSGTITIQIRMLKALLTI